MQNKLLFADEFNIRFAFDDIQKLPEALKKRFFRKAKFEKLKASIEKEKLALERQKLTEAMKLQKQKDRAALEREKVKARTALKRKHACMCCWLDRTTMDQT